MEDRGGGREVVDDSSTGTRAWSSRERISSGRIRSNRGVYRVGTVRGSKCKRG